MLDAVAREDLSLDEMATAAAEQAATNPSSFEALLTMVTLLYVARDAPDARVTRHTTPVGIAEWVQELVRDLVRGDRDDSLLRHPYLADAHAYALRLAVHACSAPHLLDVLATNAEQDADGVARQWTTNVLLAAERFSAFAADRFPDPHVAAFHLQHACAQLQFATDQPGRTFDRFNPMLFGPTLVNHERWLLLHALDVTWDSLRGDAETPLWWTDEVRDALDWLASHPEPHEDLLVVPDVQNGLGITLDQPPSALSRQLLDRARTTPVEDE